MEHVSGCRDEFDPSTVGPELTGDRCKHLQYQTDLSPWLRGALLQGILPYLSLTSQGAPPSLPTPQMRVTSTDRMSPNTLCAHTHRPRVMTAICLLGSWVVPDMTGPRAKLPKILF